MNNLNVFGILCVAKDKWEYQENLQKYHSFEPEDD